MENPITLEKITALEGWMTLPAAARVLGVGRATVHKLIKQRKFQEKDLRRAGPVILIRETAVRSLAFDRSSVPEVSGGDEVIL